MDNPEGLNWDDEEQLDPAADAAVTRKLFRQWRAPRYGKSNPERMNNPVWEWLIRSRVTAYAAAQRFEEPSPLEFGPGWCFYRFGRTGTALPDGRKVLIAGEHEDSYDPDFYIYNDVVVLHPDGRIDIFGYPREVFPPTDFHSATFAGNRIIIIGGLSYPEERKPGVTRVYSLDTTRFAISTFPTSGTSPGWIHRHTASLSPDGSAICVKGGRIDAVRNINEWRLGLASATWEQVTAHPWQVWQIGRKDGKLLHLWQIRTQLSLASLGQHNDVLAQLQKQFGFPTLEEDLGGPPDAEALSKLYEPPIPHEKLPGTGEHNLRCLRIEGVTARYEEDLDAIEVTFEGALPQNLINTVARDLQAKLARLERSPCVRKKL